MLIRQPRQAVGKNNVLSAYLANGKAIKRLTQPTPKIANASSGITVSWNKITGASGYYIYRKAGNAEKWSRVASISDVSTLKWTDKNVTNGQKYTYTVKAYSGSYVSSYNAGKTYYRVNRTSVSSLKNSSSKKMAVVWSKNSKATGYQVQYSTSSSFSSYSTKSTTGTKLTISGLTKGKTYYVRVRCYKTVSGTKYWSGWSAAKKVKISK